MVLNLGCTLERPVEHQVSLGQVSYQKYLTWAWAPGIWFNWSGVWPLGGHWDANSLLARYGIHSEFKWVTGIFDFLCQLHQAMISSLWSGITLDTAMKVFLDVINVYISRLLIKHNVSGHHPINWRPLKDWWTPSKNILCFQTQAAASALLWVPRPPTDFWFTSPTSCEPVL